MDLIKLADAVLRQVRGYVQPAIDSLTEQVNKAMSSLAARVDALESRQPDKGDPGRDGSDGNDGRDGIDGKDGAPGEQGAPGQNGKDGRDGADGKSITLDDVQPILENAVTKWALEFERRAQDVLQRAIDRIPTPKDGKDGADGKDGRDAIDIDGFELTQSEDGRTVTLSLERGDVRKEKSFTVYQPDYRGVWRDGEYSKGDFVTFGGSAFIATRDTTSRPETDDSWKLFVKRGRDGKDGQRGEKGDPGPRGPKGEPPVELQTGKIR